MGADAEVSRARPDGMFLKILVRRGGRGTNTRAERGAGRDLVGSGRRPLRCVDQDQGEMEMEMEMAQVCILKRTGTVRTPRLAYCCRRQAECVERKGGLLFYGYVWVRAIPLDCDRLQHGD